jgi:hypothetical protein
VHVTSFEPSMLAEVAGDAAAGPADALVGDDLLAEPDGRLRFRHRMLRDVAYGMLPHRRRQELHEQARLALEAAPAVPLERAVVL